MSTKLTVDCCEERTSKETVDGPRPTLLPAGGSKKFVGWASAHLQSRARIAGRFGKWVAYPGEVLDQALVWSRGPASCLALRRDGLGPLPLVENEAWRAGRDSNPQPPDPKSDALSVELPARPGHSNFNFRKWTAKKDQHRRGDAAGHSSLRRVRTEAALVLSGLSSRDFS